MSKEIKGRLVNLKVRVYPSATWKTIVCAEGSTFSITNELSKRETNCGIKAAPGIPDFSATVNAVQNADPSSSEMAYKEIKDLITSGTKVQFLYQNEADVANGVAEAEGIYNKGNGYFTQLDSDVAATSDGLLTYTLTLEGVGTLDDFDES